MHVGYKLAWAAAEARRICRENPDDIYELMQRVYDFGVSDCRENTAALLKEIIYEHRSQLDPDLLRRALIEMEGGR